MRPADLEEQDNVVAEEEEGLMARKVMRAVVLV